MAEGFHELKIDLELESFMPKLTEETRMELEKSLKENGCYNPIHVWNGVIVDGHNRYRICRENNIPFDIEEHQFADKCEAMKWMLDEQNCRRNMSEVERIEAALKYKDALMKKGKEKQGQRTDLLSEMTKSDNPFDTRTEIAKLAGKDISRTKVQQVERIFNIADEETKEDLRKGRKKVGTVYNEMFPAKKKNEPEPDSKSAEPVKSNHEFNREFSLRQPLTDDMDIFTGALNLGLAAKAVDFDEWGEKLKAGIRERPLKGKNPDGSVLLFAYGNAMNTFSDGIGDEEIELSDDEQSVINGLNGCLEELHKGVQDTLDNFNPLSAHPALFAMMIRKLKDAFALNSAEVVSYLWDLERMRTYYFGRDSEYEESFQELEQESKNEQES